MADCKAVSTPIDQQIENANLNDSPVSDTFYGRIIGSFMYVTICSRLDISFVVGRLLQYMEYPTKCLSIAVNPLSGILLGIFLPESFIIV